MTTLQHVHLLYLQDNKTPLHYAVENGESFTVKKLLDKGASVDCIDKVSDYITTCINYVSNETKVYN